MAKVTDCPSQDCVIMYKTPFSYHTCLTVLFLLLESRAYCSFLCHDLWMPQIHQETPTPVGHPLLNLHGMQGAGKNHQMGQRPSAHHWTLLPPPAHRRWEFSGLSGVQCVGGWVPSARLSQPQGLFSHDFFRSFLYNPGCYNLLFLYL